MELVLDMCLRPLGPWARAACTPGLVTDGERRFVVEVVGPGAIVRVGGLMAGYGDLGGKDALHCGRETGKRGSVGEGKERGEGTNERTEVVAGKRV